MGSSKVASSDQRRSLVSEGRPAKRSRTLPMVVFWWSVRVMPGAVWILSMFSMRGAEAGRGDVLAECDLEVIKG